MKTNEIYLKTAFACMACDGEIANEEVALIKRITADEPKLFEALDVESTLNGYISEINEKGKAFLFEYLREVANAELSESEQLQILTIAIKMIEADEKIEYPEIAFFKKIRFKLDISDDAILKKFPDKQNFLLPDIMIPDEIDLNVLFDDITLK